MNYLLFASQAYSISILRPLQEAILKKGDKVSWYINNLSKTLLEKNELLLTTVQEVKDYNPDAIFIPGNWVPDFFPGVKVEIFHGFGIEKKGHFRIRGFFDLYCTHGPATTKPFNKLAKKHGYFSVVETGWPKMDPLFDNKSDALPTSSEKNKTVILYAPTFSPSLSSALALFESIKFLSQNSNYRWIIKFHPKMDKSIINLYQNIQNDQLAIADNSDIIPLLHTSDIMISDTSSVISEFLLLDKPVITFNNRTPGPHLFNITEPEQLSTALQTVIQTPKNLLKESKAFIDQMHPYRDGKSSDRILDATENIINNNLTRKKPLNLWRKIKIRKSMKYYHI